MTAGPPTSVADSSAREVVPTVFAPMIPIPPFDAIGQDPASVSAVRELVLAGDNIAPILNLSWAFGVGRGSVWAVRGLLDTL